MTKLQSDILVLGQGFGGIYTIIDLIKHPQAKTKNITLVGQDNFFLFTPLLHEVATGGLNPNEITISINNLFGQKINFINGTVQVIDLDQRSVQLTNNLSIGFDNLVIATGAKSKKEIIPGAFINAHFLKTIDDAKKIKNRLIQIFEDLTLSNKPININVLGGGPTGVEIICEIYEYIYATLLKNSRQKHHQINLNLITADNELIKMYKPSIKKTVFRHLTQNLKINILLNETCKQIDKTSLQLTNKTIDSDLTIATIGVQPNLPTIIGEIKLDTTGRIITNQYLQLPNHQFAYAIGDIASGNPMDAQVAVKQAKITSHNIANSFDNNNLKEFKYTSMGKFLSLGRNNASGQLFNFGLTGRFVWFIWRTIYLSKMPTLRKKIYIGITWALGLFYPRDTTKFD